MASVTTRFGNRSMNASFTAGEKSAAVLDSENHAERSRSSSPGSSSASSSGRAIASPVIMMLFTFSSAIARHTRAGSNLPTSTTLLPRNEPPITPHCVAPCMSGAIGSIVVGPPASACSTSAPGMIDPVLDTGSMPPPSAKNTSSWRHTTPLGMPVVPPV